MNPNELYASPNALAPEYSRFRVGERLLLTGHSHQAWPDCGFAGQKQAWEDAAEFVDEKWSWAFAKADAVRAGYARILDDTSGYYALASNTHDLVVRFLSALPLVQRRRLVTTDGEYHTIRRQLDRLEEEGIEIVRIAAAPIESLPERLAQAVDENTAAVLASAVLFHSAQIVPNLGHVLDACQYFGAELLVDAYHALNVVPYTIAAQRLESAFIVGGGYKYCQLGEGNCFLRFPKECKLRPVVTGWFSEFSTLADAKDKDVLYGEGVDRFAGSTYDPTSHYRAAAVFEFFGDRQLTPSFLRAVSQHQVRRLIERFEAIAADPAVVRRESQAPVEALGGFLALRTPYAAPLFEQLHDRGVLTDYRADILRLGPAPYLADAQLDEAMDVFSEVVLTIS